MHPAYEHHIPDGLLAANVLLSQNSHQGLPAPTNTLHQGFVFAISSTVRGLQFRCWEIASGTVDAPSNATCAGKTVPVGNNIRVQSNSQGMITGVGVVLTGPSGYQSGGSGGYTSIAPNTILGVSLGAGGALNIGLNNPLYFKPGGAGAFTGAYISSATFNNGSFSQVSGAVAFEGIPFGSRYTPSSYLANQFNQNSSLTNVAQLLQSTAQLAQSLVGCSVVVGH